jgi:hypothetical protein
VGIPLEPVFAPQRFVLLEIHARSLPANASA